MEKGCRGESRESIVSFIGILFTLNAEQSTPMKTNPKNKLYICIYIHAYITFSGVSESVVHKLSASNSLRCLTNTDSWDLFPSIPVYVSEPGVKKFKRRQ